MIVDFAIALAERRTGGLDPEARHPNEACLLRFRPIADDHHVAALLAGVPLMLGPEARARNCASRSKATPLSGRPDPQPGDDASATPRRRSILYLDRLSKWLTATGKRGDAAGGAPGE